MEARERTIDYFLPDGGGEAPYGKWFQGITDTLTRARILRAIAKMRSGNFSDSEPIGDGASENKLDFGAGYRIYYGIDGGAIILLYGGTKSNQSADILTARGFWAIHQNRKKLAKEKAEQEQKNAQKSKLQARPSRRPKK